MWPALAQLLELLPHFTRLIPALDRFVQSKSTSDEANRQAFASMTEGLRTDLGQVAAAHAGLYRQLNDQSEKLATVASSVAAVQLSADSLEARMTGIEGRLTRLQYSVAAILFMLAAISFLLAIILLHSHR